jgi:hypothetical protein
LIQSLFVSIWIVAATLAAVYFGVTMELGKPAGEAQQEAKPPTQIKLKSMTVPVVAEGAVQGYILTQITISLKTELMKSLPQPPELLLTDEVFRTIYGEEQIDFKRIQKTDLGKLAAQIGGNINARVGAPVADNVFIQELHYMNKRDASPEAQSHH